MSPPTYFPLRWESTGDQWWYASPIDWAAANGHYDLVRELLRLDGNHLIQLTSLRRIRRLETVWDDEEQFEEVAKCRSEVARKLLRECEMKKGKNSLVGGGYGGWVLYTAASAGDLSFVGELLERDPLLVFGEGEYGVTDVLYAAARSKKSEVFRMVLDYAAAPRLVDGDIPSAYKVEIMKRAVHAAARGGNLQLLKELLLVGDAHTHMLGYRDVEGATVLHAAAARGQLDVVKDLASNYPEVVNSRDNEGNTALHVAAQRGHLHVVEALIPCLMSARNNAGETFVHAVVSGFNTPGFRRVDRQMEVMKHALALENNTEIINARNNDGKTALHLAITGTGNIHSDLVQLLMSDGCIDVNIRDSEGMTPLDLLRQRPMSERQLITGGGGMMLSYSARKAVASQMKRQRQSSPGSSFRISDTEIFLYTSTASPTPTPTPTPKPTAEGEMDSVLKRILHWPRKRDKVVDGVGSSGGVPVPLRQRFSSNKDKNKNKNKNKRPLSVSVSSSSSPTPKKKLMLMTATRAPASASASHRSRSSSFSKLSFSSHSSLNDTPKDKDKDDAAKSRHSFVNKMLCFGHNDPIDLQPYHIYERSVLSAA